MSKIILNSLILETVRTDDSIKTFVRERKVGNKLLLVRILLELKEREEELIQYVMHAFNWKKITLEYYILGEYNLDTMRGAAQRYFEKVQLKISDTELQERFLS